MAETKIMIHDKEELDVSTVYKDHHTGVRGVFLNDANEVLIEHLNKFDLYTLPGGYLESDEGPEEAFKREVLEETGYSCEIIQQLTTIEEYRQKQ